MAIKLNNLLNLSPNELKRTKIRLNIGNKKDGSPIDLFKTNPQKLADWNFWNNKSYKVGQISIGLIRLSDDKWVLYTVADITKIIPLPVGQHGIGCEYKERESCKAYFGRIIVRFHNKSQQTFRDAEKIIDQCEVSEILPDVYTGFDFPGYDNVMLSYTELKTIVKGNYPGYKKALEKQKAVYVITDTNTGKLYVGSATSENNMLLARWTSYVNTYHGGNIKLRELVKKRGEKYVEDYFQYSIIENYNQKTDDKYILERESYWKDVLKTRDFGYNDN